jgi:type II secretory pathway pseudopilin PulG
VRVGHRIPHTCPSIHIRLPNPRPSSPSGFTILEVVIALGILAFGSVAVISLFASAVRQYKDAVNTTQMALLADQVLAEAQTKLDSTANPTEIPWKSDPTFPHFEYKVVFTKADLPYEYKVRVIIGWGTENPSPVDDNDRFKSRQDFYTVLLKQP